MPDKRKPIQPELGLQSAAPGERCPSARNGGAIRTHEATREGGAAMPVERIVSGGQTGADRAALDFAIAHGIPHGGWCPRGRLAEDGALERCYELKETPEEDYPQRTEWNVRDSDGTVLFCIAPELTGGSKLTAALAAELGKPCLHLSQLRDGPNAVARLRSFVSDQHVRVLNVAGPRASNEPAVARFVIETLERLFNIPETNLREWTRYPR